MWQLTSFFPFRATLITEPGELLEDSIDGIMTSVLKSLPYPTFYYSPHEIVFEKHIYTRTMKFTYSVISGSSSKTWRGNSVSNQGDKDYRANFIALYTMQCMPVLLLLVNLGK